MNETQTETFVSPDISCGHCVMKVEGAVGALHGVQKVEASSESKEVAVVFDPSTVSTAQIETALAKAGYPAAPH